MKVAIHQPQYFPWPRYVHKVMSADIFVYLDTVQFSKNGLQNRNQIKGPHGPLWLTVPVKHEFGQTIKQTRIAQPATTKKHLKTITSNYAHAVGLKKWQSELDDLLESSTESLVDLSIASTEWMLQKLDVQTKRVRASQLKETEASASKLVASICSELGATTYLSGAGALEYMNEEDFSSVKCELWIQQWTPLVYPQQHGDFLPNLSTLDLLLNCPDEAASLIQSCGSWGPLP